MSGVCSRAEKLQELVVRALGGIEQVRKIADLPDLPGKAQPDTLRELARFLLGDDEHSKRVDP